MLPDNLSSLRVVDLKKELTDRNLPTKGKKDDLVARLQEWVNEQKANDGSAQNGDSDQAPAADEPMQEVEEPEIKQDHPIEAESAMTEPTTTTEETPTQTLAHTEPVAPTEPNPATDDATPLQTVEETKPQTPAGTTEEEAVSSTEGDRKEKAAEDADTKGTKRKRQAPVEDDKSPEKRSKPSTDKESQATPQQQKAPLENTITSSAIYIKGFVRPLIVRHVQELIGQYGTVKRFWMDAIKTHCYVIYESTKEAQDAFAGIDGIIFPRDTGRKVQVGGLTPEQAEVLIGQEQAAAAKSMKLDWEKMIEAVRSGEVSESGGSSGDQAETRRPRLSGIGQITRELQKAATASVLAPASALPTVEERSIHLVQSDSGSGSLQPQTEPLIPPPAPTASLDELFRKTTALPNLYYLPVNEEVAKQRLEKLSRNLTSV
ncbi:hypothetical protein BJV82DRAFT_304677 [Fennellomyces sp. T-0311]|nr:hypothetical protein BJV82DRAFT_304677 [Fennellomyces sp. T-0311]